jgi:S-adenosyl-L-methionine hydrolase (adenosine-forming)
MAIITLTTDFGIKDYYVGAVKGAIISQLPDVTIVDISHQVPQFNLQQAAYILKNAFPHFPKDTIHIIGVNEAATEQSPHVVVYAMGHYFIGADSGIFSLLLDKTPDKLVKLTISSDTGKTSFPTQDIFTKAACHIARGGSLEIIGTIKDKLKEMLYFRPTSNDNSIRGNVMYIDSYYNIVFNITQQLFNEVAKGRVFTIYLKNYTISEIKQTYNQVPEGEVLAMFNSEGFLEIAQHKGMFARQENIQLNEMITIQFT